MGNGVAGLATVGRPTVAAWPPSRRGVLQRKCACGGSDHECEDCNKKKRVLQRKAATACGPGPGLAPPIVHEVLRSPGEPLSAPTRVFMEARFGHDFSRIRVHADSFAAASARSIRARAYTSGYDVVFGGGQPSLATAEERTLLAHELAHSIQQEKSATTATARSRLAVGPSDDPCEREADRIAEAVAERPAHVATASSPLKVQRLGFFESIGVLLGISEGDYSRDELVQYLGIINTSKKIEGSYDSDNKARDVVRKWTSGKLDVELFPITKKLLILEMQDGVVLDGDREGILTLLQHSGRQDLLEIFSPGGVNPKQLRKDLDSGTFKKRLESFFNSRFEGGAEALVEKHVVKPVGGVELSKMSPEKRREFINGHFEKADRTFAMQILEDLIQSAAELDFADEKALADEIGKRMRTSRLMQESQKLFGRAFEYPNKPTAKACLPENKGKPLVEQKPNPRVNEAAKNYWGPVQEGSPVPGYQSSYYFELTPQGKEAAYQSLTTLFTPQDSICKMTLIHCDYLASVVHLRAFAETIGIEEFNQRVRKGLLEMKLTYFGFQYLEPYLAKSGKAVSLQEVRPGSEEDLIIGDHVIFWNHRAYDLINVVIRNAWRLENAILTERREKEDYFLGHGSGKRTKLSMKKVLLEEYNKVAGQALDIIGKTKSKDPKTAAPARKDMDTKFPNIKEFAGGWRIIGVAHSKMFNDPLKKINDVSDPELIGLHDPEDPSKMNYVKRPIESSGRR